jgi:hypothetical protein
VNLNSFSSKVELGVPKMTPLDVLKCSPVGSVSEMVNVFKTAEEGMTGELGRIGSFRL